MVWLYLPESEGLTSELTSLFPRQEPCVTSRGKPMRPQSLERKWKKGGYIRLLSGLMLPPSTGDLLLEKWITSLPDSLANPGVSPESKKEQKMKDGFGTTLKESFAKFDHASYSWKTSQASLMGELTPFLGIWPQSGSMLNGVCSKRQKLVQDITETVSFSLDIVPTPTTDCAQNRSGKYSQGGTSLALHVMNFPTPTLAESKNSPYQTSNGKRYPTLLGHVQMFPTPTAQEAQKAWKFAKGQMGQSLSAMSNRGELFNTPTTRDGANSTLPPSHANWDSLTGDMIRLGEARPGGVLNPEWVEWLMGWPIGWTDLERVVMELSHFKQQSHIPSSSKEQLKEVV